MKRFLCLMLVLVMVAAFFAACGKTETKEEQTTTEATDEATTESTASNCAHVWSEASCYSPKTCSLCGATEGGPYHNYALEEFETVRPNCTDGGVEQYYCEICDDPKTVEVPALGHDYVEGVCTQCDAVEPQS